MAVLPPYASELGFGPELLMKPRVSRFNLDFNPSSEAFSKGTYFTLRFGELVEMSSWRRYNPCGSMKDYPSIDE